MSLEHLNWEEDSDVINVTPKSQNSETPSSNNLTASSSDSPEFRPQSRMSRMDNIGKRSRREMHSSPSDYEYSPPPIVYPNEGTRRVRIRAREISHRPIYNTEEGVPPLYRQYFIQCGDCACSLEGRVIHEYASDNNN